MQQSVLVNGMWDVGVSAYDRGLGFGDGVFETLLNVGGQFPLLQYHLERLSQSCEVLALPICLKTVREHLDIFARAQCARANSAENSANPTSNHKYIVKLIVTRGDGGEGYIPPRDNKAQARIIAFKREYKIPAAASLCLVSASSPLGINPGLAGHKHLSCLEYVLAGRTPVKANQQLLLSSTEGHVIEALHHNIFWLKGNQLYTPMLDRCGVAGVMRNLILQHLAPAIELSGHGVRANLTTLEKADEVFLCNAVRGIIAVSKINERRIGRGSVVPLLQQCLSSRYAGAYD